MEKEDAGTSRESRGNSMRRALHFLSLVLVGCAAIGLTAACSEDPQAPTQVAKQVPPPPKPADKPPESKPPPESLSKQLAGTAELVASYPEDAPVYPGANLSSSTMRGHVANAVFSTSDPTADVVAWMRDFMTTNGWQILPAADMGRGTLIQAEKGSRSLSVIISEVNEDGSLTMMIVSATP